MTEPHSPIVEIRPLSLNDSRLFAVWFHDHTAVSLVGLLCAHELRAYLTRLTADVRIVLR